MDPKAYRLPEYALPTRYDIHIEAHLDKTDANGKVDIQLEMKEPHDTIVLHARFLTVTKATVSVAGKTLSGDVTQDADREIATIKFGEAIPAGQATLSLDFENKVSTGLEGLYLAEDGPERCLCTQCEATAARQIFPCFDEPIFKAQFAWHVTTSADATVLANSPVKEVEERGSDKIWHFEPTKKMSSYLVALVIGDIASTPEETVNGTPIRVWALRGKERLGAFAHSYTKRLLTWYEDYFDLPYHFDKYDQVAVPGFSAGAMENSGLVLFRQGLLLMRPETASWDQEKTIAGVVAHEFAHMWFGDVVTMRWWDDLWLNEAFAEWMSNKALNALSPEYNIWNDFQAGKVGALANDSLESTHPIYNAVETPAQAAEMFDAITYEKGCSVMRMLENFLGEEDFRNGIRSYMKEFKESNASGADLWRHLQSASSKPVASIMESWVKQGGYPVVSVALENSENGARLRLKQERFFARPDVKSGKDQLWKVPVVLRYSDNGGTHDKQVLLSERETVIPLELQGELEYLYANVEEIGFYRQSMSPQLLEKLLSNLGRLSPLEQTGLLGDQWALVRNGTQKIGAFLDVLAAMSGIENYSVLERVYTDLHQVEDLLEDTGDKEAIERFRRWVDSAFKGQLDAIGFRGKAGESRNDSQRRPYLVGIMAGIAHNKDAVAEAEKFADMEAEDPGSVDANLASTVVNVAAQFGDRERMDRNVELYKKRRAAGMSPQETNRYLSSLTAFEKPELVSNVLSLMDDKVLPQEATGPTLRTMFGARYSQLQAWEYLKKHWKSLTDSLGEMWPGFLVEGTGNLPADRRDDIVTFFDANLNGMAEMSYRRALETLDQKAEFRARTKDDLLAWFRDK